MDKKGLEILRGQCLNIAGSLVAARYSREDMSTDQVLDLTIFLAKKLFNRLKEEKFEEWS